jgi:hypothetical protein
MYVEYLCKTCADAIQKCASTLKASPDECGGPECALCGHDDFGEGECIEIESIALDDPLIERLQNGIYACGAEGCGRKSDKGTNDYLWDETNAELRELRAEIISGLERDSAYHALLKEADYLGKDDEFELANLRCRKCGSDLKSWCDDIKMRVRKRIIPAIPEGMPAEVNALPALAPSARIEYHRPDCSLYLTHFTRGGSVATHIDNVDEAEQMTDLSARNVLWVILATSTLKAFKGVGLHRSAICFTEKPLGAIKDTLVGVEASVRKKSSIRWAPWGVMFEKDYLRDLGAQPVIACSPRDESLIPEVLRYRMVPLTDRTNFLHEREWRLQKDVKFDIRQCVVLVPNFEQATALREALAKLKLHPKGFIPLFDVFAAL